MSTRLNSVELPENIQLIPGHNAEIKLEDLPNSSDCTTTMTYISVDDVEINQSCSVKTSTYQVIDSSKQLVTVHQGEPSTGRIVDCPYTMTMDQGVVTVNATCKLADLPNYLNKPQFTANPDTDIPYSYGATYGSSYGDGSNRPNGNPMIAHLIIFYTKTLFIKSPIQTEHIQMANTIMYVSQIIISHILHQLIELMLVNPVDI